MLPYAGWLLNRNGVNRDRHSGIKSRSRPANMMTRSEKKLKNMLNKQVNFVGVLHCVCKIKIKFTWWHYGCQFSISIWIPDLLLTIVVSCIIIKVRSRLFRLIRWKEIELVLFSIQFRSLHRYLYVIPIGIGKSYTYRTYSIGTIR